MSFKKQKKCSREVTHQLYKASWFQTYKYETFYLESEMGIKYNGKVQGWGDSSKFKGKAGDIQVQKERGQHVTRSEVRKQQSVLREA